MRLSGQKPELTIDSSNVRFTGTPYEGEDFMLVMSTDTTSGLLSAVKARKEANDRGLGQEGVVALAYGKYDILTPIKEWDGFEDENGQPLECNDDNKDKFFNDPVFADFWNIVRGIYQEETARKTDEEEAIEEGLGESGITSDGSTDQVAELA